MPKLRDNDLAKWTYDLHTAVKHRILKTYLTPWVMILSTTGRGLVYVDGFSGRGRYPNGEPGSPLVALEALALHRNRSVSLTCHFVEKDPVNFANMRAEVERHQAVVSGRIRAYFYNAPFSVAGDTIVQRIRRADQPSFFFVDPFGYTDTPMALLGRVLALPKAEIFVNLMFSAIRRGLGSDDPTLHTTLDELVGAPDWRDVCALPRSQWERSFVNLYRHQLKRHGAAFGIPFRMGDDDRATTLYYLIHATKHIKGATLMKHAMTVSATPGELGYTGGRHHLTPLFDLDVSNLAGYLLRTFAGRTLSFDDIVAQTIEETGTCRETHYNQCLKQLEKMGRVTVRRVSTVRGLSGLDEVTFPGQLALLSA
jgi:three-Cys-motif partner protein